MWLASTYANPAPSLTKEEECKHIRSFEDAIKYSHLIFIGEVFKIQQGPTDKPYVDYIASIKPKKIWQETYNIINKGVVKLSININKRNPMHNLEEGKEYLAIYSLGYVSAVNNQ